MSEESFSLFGDGFGETPDLILFEGNWPGNVNKDSKYSIRSESRKYVVGVEYRTRDGEKWYPTAGDHEDLVNMVNQVKLATNGTPGGPFYINEYRQVIVPSSEGKYYYAGDYTNNLVFVFEGHSISGDAMGLDGTPLAPGSRWDGPHPGIPYVVKANGQDIYYTKQIRPRVKKDSYLSDYVGKDRAKEVARAIGRFKMGGGRIYINEYRVILPCS